MGKKHNVRKNEKVVYIVDIETTTETEDANLKNKIIVDLEIDRVISDAILKTTSEFPQRVVISRASRNGC